MGFELRGIEHVELSLVSTNTGGQRLYERLGLETFGLQENYVRAGDLHWHQRHMQLKRETFLARAGEILLQRSPRA